MKTKLISLILTLSLMAMTFAGTVLLPAQAANPIAPRQMELLDRGLVAISQMSGRKIYLSWRLLGWEDYSTAFNVYCDGVKINSDPIIDSTNFLHEEKNHTAGTYQVAAVVDGIEQEKSAPVTPITTTYATNEYGGRSEPGYLDIPLVKPPSAKAPDGSTYTYTANDASCGDLDGDGEYEIVLKWEPSNAQDNSKTGYTGNVYLDAYKLDGTRLWDNYIDLGTNIRAGAHYTQLLVFDADGDGKAEISCRTAPGTTDTTGAYVNLTANDGSPVDNSADYRNADGIIHPIYNKYTQEADGPECPEFYTVFDGNGVKLDSIDYPIPTGNMPQWGDNYGNRSDRFLGAIAYLDGVHPSIVTWRGYYTRTAVAAMRLDKGKLSITHQFDTKQGEAGYQDGYEAYEGQGNHNLTVGDVDGDGRDELICGSLCLEDDLSVRWCSFKGHGDAGHLGDFDPTHPGLEYMTVHETPTENPVTGHRQKWGMTVYDASTGEDLHTYDAAGAEDMTFEEAMANPKAHDTGRGIIANVGPVSENSYYQAWASNVYAIDSTGQTLKNPENPDEYLTSFAPWTTDSSGTYQKITGANFRIYWNGDLYDDLLDSRGGTPPGLGISAWNAASDTFVRIFTPQGSSVNGSKANPVLQADLLGDFKEELIMRLSDDTLLRVYLPTSVTTHKLYTPMHDSLYRTSVAWQNVAYNQPPHLGYYVSDDYATDFAAAKPNAVFVTPPVEASAIKITPEDDLPLDNGVYSLSTDTTPVTIALASAYVDADGRTASNTEPMTWTLSYQETPTSEKIDDLEFHAIFDQKTNTLTFHHAALQGRYTLQAYSTLSEDITGKIIIDYSLVSDHIALAPESDSPLHVNNGIYELSTDSLPASFQITAEYRDKEDNPVSNTITSIWNLSFQPDGSSYEGDISPNDPFVSMTDNCELTNALSLAPGAPTGRYTIRVKAAGHREVAGEFSFYLTRGSFPYKTAFSPDAGKLSTLDIQELYPPDYPASVFVAAYQPDGCIASVNYYTIDTYPNAIEDVTIPEGGSVKVFVWDIQTHTPYSSDCTPESST